MEKHSPLLAAFGLTTDGEYAPRSATPIDQRHLALLLEAQHIGRIGNWERDLRTNQLWWSDECYRLFGYAPGSVAPSYGLFLQHVHAEDRQRVSQAMAKNRTDGQPYEVEYRIIDAIGQLRHILHHGRSDFDLKGQPLRTSGTAQDITERKQIETEFRRQHAHLKAVLDHMPQGITVFDEKLSLRLWNQAFVDIMELPAQALHEGMSYAELMRIPVERGEYGPGNTESLINNLCVRARRFEAHRSERVRPNGRAHLEQGSPFYLDDQIAGFVTTYTDITERRASEDRLRRQYEQLEVLVDNMPSGVTFFDANLDLAVYNAQFQKLLDLPDTLFAKGAPGFEEIVRFNAERGEYGDLDPEATVKYLVDQARHPVAHQMERIRPNGTALDIRGTPLSSGGFVTIYTDITDLRRSEERQQLADSVFEHSPSGIVIADGQQRVITVNPAFTAITGAEPAELAGRTIDSLLLPNTGPQFLEIAESLASRGHWSGEAKALRKSGEQFIAGIRVSRVDDHRSGLPHHYIWQVSDITEAKLVEDRVRHLAQHDSLTGLPNRLALLTRLAQVLPDARRHQRFVAVMFLDLDRFKIINDTLGHQTGDELLRDVAVRLSAMVRETDMVARLGGDEFVVVLPDIASAADAAMVAGKIIASLANPFQIGPQELHTTPSIGISVFPTDGSDADTLLKNADTAMYHAKGAGRNNYQFYAAEMNQAASERLNLETKLRQAVARNEMALVFQPQFAVDGKTPIGVEALLRWHHPTEGMISPARFIPIAEETGLIVRLGEWVLINACREMKHWIDSGLPPLRVAVNVSARQLRRRDFCETVAGALAESGLPAELLELEITESAVMENPAEAIGILETLGRMGVTLAIDDFGTGYSSLSYLKLFPIDHLKIDRSFVRDIEHDLNDRAIALGTIALAHSLGLRVIAEGVETDDQLELLSTNGCDEVQGYLFSQPLGSSAAFSFLHARCAAE